MAVASMLNEEVVTLSPRKKTSENKLLLRHESKGGLVVNSSKGTEKNQ